MELGIVKKLLIIIVLLVVNNYILGCMFATPGSGMHNSSI
jgi:hypothetical protein